MNAAEHQPTTQKDELMSFANPAGGEIIRGVMLDNLPYFVGKDICIALGYSNHNKAMNDHCKGVTKRYPLHTPGGVQEVRIIAEPDMYRLICGSKLPGAQRFESWVFEEVLPALRKSGGYLMEQAGETPEQLMARALKIAEETLARYHSRNLQLEREAEAARPKITFADAVADSDSTCLVGELAKLIKQNGVEIGQNRLFKWMRENGFLTKNNAPTQRAMEQSLFHVVERVIIRPDGSSISVRTTKVTGKGQLYFINAFLSKKSSEDEYLRD